MHTLKPLITAAEEFAGGREQLVRAVAEANQNGNVQRGLDMKGAETLLLQLSGNGGSPISQVRMFASMLKCDDGALLRRVDEIITAEQKQAEDQEAGTLPVVAETLAVDAVGSGAQPSAS